jgi:hypothetical protein
MHLAGVEPATFGSVGELIFLPKSLKNPGFSSILHIWVLAAIALNVPHS